MEKILVRLIKAKKKLLGKEQEEILSSIAMVVLVYNFKGQWKEAEELEV